MTVGAVSQPSLPTALLLLTSFLFVTSASASITSQFQHFYPQHGSKYSYILKHNCSQEFANYLTGRPQDFELDWLGGGGTYTVLVQPVVKCLLDNISEYIKAASSSAQVLLGVTPPILATLGPSTDELGLLSVIGRRPLLSLLLSFGSPGVYTDRVFSFRQPEKLLVRTRGQYRLYRPDTPARRWTWAAVQYILAAGAAANIATLTWQLGVSTVCCWWAETVYAPLVWVILSVPIHLAGTFLTRLRVRRIDSEEERESPGFGLDQWLKLFPTKLYGFWKSEWVPAVAQGEIRTISFEEGSIYIAASWFLSTSTIIYILFGSLVLSGLLFIGPRDALFVIFRYVLSVLVCRILVVYELAGIRSNHIPEPDKQPKAGLDGTVISTRANHILDPDQESEPKGAMQNVFMRMTY